MLTLRHRFVCSFALVCFLFISFGCSQNSDSKDSAGNPSEPSPNEPAGLRDDDDQSLSPRPDPETPVQSTYFIAQFEDQKHNLDKNVRFIVTGQGVKLGTLFQEAAVSKARRIKELYPKDQILFVFYNEATGKSQSQAAYQMKKLKDWGLKNVEKSGAALTTQALLDLMKNYREIRSLDIYSHANYDYLVLSEQGHFYDSYDLLLLKNKFSADATVQLHGCNTGWNVAPALAKMWKVPVAGSLTSTNFEHLHSNGNFYFNDDLFKPTGAWATENNLSFDQKTRCQNGGCLRMRPDNRPYEGIHGKLKSGLPFYKYFCGGLLQSECDQRKAMALLEFIDLVPTKDLRLESRQIQSAQNFLCPIHKSKSLREDCRKALILAESSADHTYSPFAGIALHCNNEGCEENKHSKSTAFVDEYFSYLNGIHYKTW
ncbi:MAG: hypothetical protein ACK5P5_13990 [Pseudobdellovibrionaceae bacterium]